MAKTPPLPRGPAAGRRPWRRISRSSQPALACCPGGREERKGGRGGGEQCRRSPIDRQCGVLSVAPAAGSRAAVHCLSPRFCRRSPPVGCAGATPSSRPSRRRSVRSASFHCRSPSFTFLHCPSLSFFDRPSRRRSARHGLCLAAFPLFSWLRQRLCLAVTQARRRAAGRRHTAGSEPAGRRLSATPSLWPRSLPR